MSADSRIWTPLDLVGASAEYLADRGVPNARLDAELLLAHVLQMNRLQVYLEHERPIVPAELDRYRELIRQRGQRVPLQLLVGQVQLLDLEFEVRPGVFIPRPETELIIERAKELLAEPPAEMVELGVGTGCIVISLLKHWPSSRAVGFDLDPAAVELSQSNARRHGVDSRLELVQADGLAQGLAPCDLLLSNPPYVPEADLEGLEPEVRDHDPRQALVSGPRGLDALCKLVEVGARVVRPGGAMALEHGEEQAAELAAELKRYGWIEPVLHRDLAGRPRVSTARRP